MADGTTPRDERSTAVLLVGTGDWWSHDALQLAAALAEEHEADVVLAQLLRDWGSGVPGTAATPNPADAARAHEAVDEARAHLRARTIPCRDALVAASRRPARAVRRLVDRHGVVLVVMDGAPRTGVGDWRWAMEPYRIARQAPVPVRLVQPGLPRLRDTG